MAQARVVVVGAGILGVTAALSMRARGYQVALFDPSPGPEPHPLAESTDISKVVRMDYGADEDYTTLGESALRGWRDWNRAWGEDLFHETGVTFLSRAPMAPGGFEYESSRLLSARGRAPVRLDAEAIGDRFPAWAKGVYVDGYFNPFGGYAESGKVVARLIAEARDRGVELHRSERVIGFIEHGSRVAGVLTARAGDKALKQAPQQRTSYAADMVVLAAGAWVPGLLPELGSSLRTTAQPVFHLKPASPEPFRAPRFPVFGADIAKTGWYGFPANEDGIVKIANHGIGRPMDPSCADRTVSDADRDRLRHFLAGTFPLLSPAPIVYTRLCIYCDTADGHFLIARHPNREGLVVATGGSGHAFKFAPVIGDIIAAAALGIESRWTHKFRWRSGPGGQSTQGTQSEEAARATRGETHVD